MKEIGFFALQMHISILAKLKMFLSHQEKNVIHNHANVWTTERKYVSIQANFVSMQVLVDYQEVIFFRLLKIVIEK